MPEPSKILIVDDDMAVTVIMQQMLKSVGYDVVSLNESRHSVMMAKEYCPDLILLDVDMPHLNGFEVCVLLKQNKDLENIPVLFLSGLNATKEKLEGFSVGGVDYITKPFQYEEVFARVKSHLHLRTLQHTLEYQKLVEEKIRSLSEAQSATIFAMAKLAESRDEDTGGHLNRVREYCRLLAEALKESPAYSPHITPELIDCIQHAAPLHDIGKVAIPDSILLKPDRLTPEEFEVMKTHSSIGAENMQVVYNNYPENAFVGMGIEIALYHHERWDGTGYPDGLVGLNIPLSARIMAIADVYDALRSDRCYRKGFSHEETMEIMREGDGSHFDPEIMKYFFELEDIFQQIQSDQPNE